MIRNAGLEQSSTLCTPATPPLIPHAGSGKQRVQSHQHGVDEGILFGVDVYNTASACVYLAFLDACICGCVQCAAAAMQLHLLWSRAHCSAPTRSARLQLYKCTDVTQARLICIIVDEPDLLAGKSRLERHVHARRGADAPGSVGRVEGRLAPAAMAAAAESTPVAASPAGTGSASRSAPKSLLEAFRERFCFCCCMRTFFCSIVVPS